MHRSSRPWQSHQICNLSIPSTWDFSMHRLIPSTGVQCELCFQFPLLGIFPCIPSSGLIRVLDRENFQFPLLGIFPCISMHLGRSGKNVRKRMRTFNSLYLGFFHASHGGRRVSDESEFFQFPLLGIFPCISPYRLLWHY